MSHGDALPRLPAIEEIQRELCGAGDDGVFIEPIGAEALPQRAESSSFRLASGLYCIAIISLPRGITT